MTRIATTGVDHIDLCVGDLGRSEPFYDLVLTVLGFRKVSEGETTVWRNAHLEIGIRAAQTPTDPGSYDRLRVGLHHLALRAESREAVDRFHRFLEDNEVEILDPQDWTRLIAVPEDFREDVDKAAHDRHVGDLELLSYEARAFDWASEGLRLVGRAQFGLKAFEGARSTWDAVRERLEGDLEADLQLPTLYQRLDDLASSDVAVKRGPRPSGHR